MTIRLTFELTLRSDYHVGAGQRAGMTVDAALLRDHNGNPVLRGTALVGLLRDGYRELKAQVEKSGLHTHWDAAADKRLLGTPTQKKRWTFSSTQLVGSAKPINQRWGAQDVARIRMNPRTRHVTPQALFYEEEGDMRLVFRFTATCYGPTETDRKDALLLVAAARKVRHLGSTRRRGRGECRIHLIDAKNVLTQPTDITWTEAVLQTFRDVWLKGEPLPSLPVKDKAAVNEITQPDAPKRLRLFVRLQEPVLIADKSEKGNAFETLLHIPGTAVLGALATRAARSMQLDDTPGPDHERFTEIFVNGGVQVSGLLPAQSDKNVANMTKLWPAVTAPRSLVQCEVYPQYGSHANIDPHTVHNRLGQQLQKCPHDHCGGKLKDVGGFLQLGASLNSHSVKKREEIHTQVDYKTGRVAEGNLFTYIMIEAGQWYVGELICQPEYWVDFCRWTGVDLEQRHELRLGKATRRGYGLVHLVYQDIPAESPASWTMLPLEQRLPDPVDGKITTTMLLMTDAILADPWFRFRRNFDEETVARLLKLPNTSRVKIIDQMCSSRGLDAFNTYRRFPRWRDEVLLAGSVVQFSLAVPDKQEAIQLLQSVEQAGIGWRHHEGFGCVAFAHPVFNPVRELNDGLPLPQIVRQLFTAPAGDSHAAWREADFREKWTKVLDDSQSQDAKDWEAIKTAYSTITRLLFLYRYSPITEIIKLLSMQGDAFVAPGPDYLWGNKKLIGREPSAKVEGDGLTRINELLVQLQKYAPSLWPLGLTLLAERVGQQVEMAREQGGEK